MAGMSWKTGGLTSWGWMPDGDRVWKVYEDGRDDIFIAVDDAVSREDTALAAVVAIGVRDRAEAFDVPRYRVVQPVTGDGGDVAGWTVVSDHPATDDVII